MSDRLGNVMEANSLVEAFPLDIAIIRDLIRAGLSMAEASFQLRQNSYLPGFFDIMKMSVSRWIEIMCVSMNMNSPGGGLSREFLFEFNELGELIADVTKDVVAHEEAFNCYTNNLPPPADQNGVDYNMELGLTVIIENLRIIKRVMESGEAEAQAAGVL